MDSGHCEKCGALLSRDDKGAYMRFRNRDAVTFLCVPCLCTEMGCSEAYMRERIEFLRENGCLLFTDV